MSEYTKLFERAGARYEGPSLSTKGLMRRAARKRRNQRITAGVVGIAVSLAALWIVANGLSFDRSETSIAPAGTETGPAAAPDIEGSDLWTLPPEGGEVVAEYAEIHVGFVYVYADGRVIWYSLPGEHGTAEDRVNEQRLTPEGVDLVRSGGPTVHPVLNGPSRFLAQADGSLLPAEVFDVAGAWADPEIRPYVPDRYAVCAGDPAEAMTLLPESAADLLRGKERTFEHEAGLGGNIPPTTCFEVTTEEARALGQILTETLGWSFVGGAVHWSRFDPGADPFGFDPSDWAGMGIDIGFRPLLPHGQWVEWGG